MSTRVSADVSQLLTQLRGIAIISVILAHTSSMTGGSHSVDKFVSNAFDIFGIIGVPIFLVISGYLYRTQTPFKIFFLRKIRKIILPWFLAGLMVYLVSATFGNQSSALNYRDAVSFIFGIKSLFWYMPLQCFFYLFFFFIPKTLYLNLFFIGINILMLAMRGDLFGLNPYLNPLNWIGFFSLGIVARQNSQKLLSALNFISIHERLFIALLFLVFISVYSIKSSFAYFGIDSLILELTAIIILVYGLRKSDKNNLLIFLGTNSFFIFLYHMPVAGFINFIYAKYALSFIVLKPVFVLILIAVSIIALNILLKIPRFDSYREILGLRT
jgi:peptidoglycan/LPS O-acetylase OafA/YrhL